MMNGFGWSIPASVIRIASISACINFWLFDSLNALVFQTLLNFEKLLSSCVIFRMASRTHGTFPSGTLRAQEVAVNSVLDISDGGFGALVGWVCVLIPPVEASLVLSVVQLTVMNWANLLLCLEVVLLRQGPRVQDRASLLRTSQVGLLQVSFFILSNIHS